MRNSEAERLGEAHYGNLCSLVWTRTTVPSSGLTCEWFSLPEEFSTSLPSPSSTRLLWSTFPIGGQTGGGRGQLGPGPGRHTSPLPLVVTCPRLRRKPQCNNWCVLLPSNHARIWTINHLTYHTPPIKHGPGINDTVTPKFRGAMASYVLPRTGGVF